MTRVDNVLDHGRAGNFDTALETAEPLFAVLPQVVHMLRTISPQSAQVQEQVHHGCLEGDVRVFSTDLVGEGMAMGIFVNGNVDREVRHDYRLQNLFAESVAETLHADDSDYGQQDAQQNFQYLYNCSEVHKSGH